MAEKKYKFTGNTINYGGRTLYEIESLRRFGDVVPGDFGGYIEDEQNLSHDGDCWIYGYGSGRAMVCGNAIVTGNSKIIESVIKESTIIDSMVKDGSTVISSTISNRSYLCSSRICEAKIINSNIQYGNFTNSHVEDVDLSARINEVRNGNIHSSKDYIVVCQYIGNNTYYKSADKCNSIWCSLDLLNRRRYKAIIDVDTVIKSAYSICDNDEAAESLLKEIEFAKSVLEENNEESKKTY